MKIVAGVVSALVLSNLAMAVMILQRQQDADERLAKVEKSVDRGEKGVARLGERFDAADRRIEDLGAEVQRGATTHAPSPAAPGAAAALPFATGPSPAPRDPAAAAPGTTPLSEAQRDAVKREVDEAVKKKLGNVPDMEAFNDPLGVMEKELELNAYQKERIKGLLDQAEVEKMKFVTDAIDPKSPDKFDFAKLNDLVAIQKKYDEQINNELNSTQQSKLAELKKQGKLPTMGGGGTFRFAVSSSKDEPNR